MNVYEIQQNILFNNLKNLLNDAIYQNFKYELNNLIKENNNFNENDINKIKQIIKLIKQPQQLLNKDETIRLSFCNSPETNHKIFKPLLSNLNSINDIIKTIDNSTQIQLIDQFKIYSESQIEFCQHLVKKIKQKSNKKQLKYLDELPLLYIGNYDKYEVKSIQLAYNMASYDPVQYRYFKKNESGNSIGSVINDVYLEYDIDGKLLKPAIEFAIYILYKDLFPLSSSTFVTPTQLIVLDNLKILSEDSPILRKLGSLKAQYNQQDIEIILEKHPEFRTELINTLEKSQPFFIQSSLFVKGQTFLKLLIASKQLNHDFNFEQIDMESYSTHIIASLLVIHSDYKPDNLVLEDGTNRIIGIDNDESLCDNEIKGNKTQIRNILFTFKDLMDKPIDQSVRDQFIKHDPYIFIFKWLLQLESKQLEYEQFIQLVYKFKIFNDENEKQTILKNKKTELNIPLVFRKNWIPSMLDRFKKIKKLLESERSITHQQLFQSIHPTSYCYYEYLLNKHHNEPLYIIQEVYLSPINDNIIDNNQNNIEEEYLPNIKQSVLEIIKTKDYDEIEDSKIFHQWMFLVFDYLKANQIEDFQFHKSWYSNNINIFFKILKNGFSKDLLESIISKLNITDTHQVFSYIIQNLSNHNVCDNIEFLITKFKIDEIKFNNFYQSLSHEQKLELKPYLTKLFNINNKINWITSMNQLLPIKNDFLDQNNNTKILTTINGDKRIISDNYWRKIHLAVATPNINKTPIVFIEDDYGNGIYVKSSIQSPGTEIAINKLSDLLFGFLTPIYELASIDNIPILLIQHIPGIILNDAILKDQDIINKIEPSNLSKQLVFAMITNRIIGIDNDESLCENEIKENKTQIESIFFTFKDLMDKPIDQSVRDQFIKHDPYIFIFKWLLQLESKQLEYEQFIQLVYEYNLFNDENQKQTILKNKKTELNIPFVFRKNWIPSILDRFKKIKKLLESERSITHQQLFQSIHPTSYSYYECLLNKHHNILYDVYFSPINDNIIDKIKNNIEEYLPNIKESVLEIIKTKDYDEIEDSKIFHQWMFLVFDYLKANQIEDFQFHKSWYSNNINIFFKILKNEFSKDLLESIISRLNITDIDRVFSFIIHNLSNLNVCDNIEFLITKFKMDISDLENNEYLINAKSLLDMALNFNNLKGNFKLFLTFLKHGSNKSIDEIKFNNFYQSLSHEQKLELKPYLTKLFNINNKINWITSMNQLLPIKNDFLDQNNNTKILTTINGDKRIISDNYWRKIHLADANTNKNNDNNIRPIVFIEDDYGNGIYVKSSIQSPGTEIAINKLSDLLFGFLTPICELASIDNIPILLIQNIPGDTLYDAILKDKDIINKIESSNLSKQLVFAMITNSGDGNLANFIVVPNNKSYNIYSINNDKSIIPSISKSIGYFKNPKQVETVLFLFNQMNYKVHQDVINCLKDLDVYKTLYNWLILLKPQHDLAITHFNSNNKNNNKNIIGISFHDGIISQLYSKLQSIKQVMNKPDSSITHLNILEIIEPLINDRYKPIISLNISIHEKLRTIQNAIVIHDQLINGKYGPSQALDKLKYLNNDFLNSEKSIENIRIIDNNQNKISQLDSLKNKYNQQDVEVILEKNPEFRNELINALEKSQPFFIQSSLFAKGQILQKLLIDNQDNKMKLDMESYSTHIIVSLLVIHSDYKADDLILEDGTNRIIGIDNYDSLCENEIKENKTQIESIFFTFKDLMDKPIDQSVRDQFIKHDPYIFIFKWLLQLESKQLEYEQFIQLVYKFKIFNDENQKQTILNNKKTELNIPFVFRKNWIPSMLDRFKKIKKLLESERSITHQQLFQSIHPTSYSYYEYLLNKHHNNPLDILYDVYMSRINDNIIDKNQNNIEEYLPNIKESVLELIKSKGFYENEDSRIFNQWMFLVFDYLKANQIEDFQFHKSWYSNNINIFFEILKYGFSKDILESIISKLNITDINQVFSYIIQNQLNHNVCDNIEFLITKFKMDISYLDNNKSLINAKSLLDLALKMNNLKGNFKLFLTFLKHGSNKSIDEIKFNNFYQSLSHEQKLELKPYLLKLFNINNKINWITSINQLFPKTDDLLDQNNNNNTKILTTINGDKRNVSKYLNKIFLSDGIPNRNNKYGRRSVVFIEDEYGNGIYVKFYPQLPGTEIAINKLSELLFGFLTPICELASIDNIPVLLIQQIPGELLIDALKKDKDIINKIESSNLSKQLVFAMISNNGDGNLANFIVVPNDTNNKSYNIYSIDNDQSFMPSISKSIGFYKNSVQVETVILLFNQMNEKIHQDVIDCFLNLDVYDTINSWLIYLKTQHDSAISHFKKIIFDKNNKETIIGVLFHNGMISQLYSKLQRIKQISNKPESTSITHLNILEIIEPLVNNRYKPIISLNISMEEKLTILKNNKFVSEKSITSSTHTSLHLLDSRSIQNASDIHSQMLNGKYGPSQALDELKSSYLHFLNLNKLIENIRNIDNNKNQISKYDLECYLKTNFIEINEKPILNKLYELIKLKELSIIYLRNNNDLNINTIYQFNLDSIVKLDLSGCDMLKSLEKSYIQLKFKIFFKSLIKLNLKNCSQLNSIRINAPVLKSLNAMNCKQLKILDVIIPNIEYLNLKGSISEFYIDISKTLENFKKIEYLNLSETDYETLTIDLKDLKYLEITSMENLKDIYFKTPSIKSINFEGCNNLKEVKSLKNDYNFNFNLLKILYNTDSVFDFMINIYPIEYLNGELFDLKKSKSISSKVKDLIIGEFYIKNEDLSKYSSSIFLKKFNDNRSNFKLGASDLFQIESFLNVNKPIEIWHLYDKQLKSDMISSSIENLYLGNIEYPLSFNSIPSSVKNLVLLNEFNQHLSPGIIPSSVQSLTFGYFNQRLSPGIIPSSVQSLTFGYCFNETLLPGTIPSSVQSFTFGICFNQPLLPGTIPSSVQSLTFGHKFNQPLFPGTIPSSVKSLTFGTFFDQPLLPGTIPSSVQSLAFGDWFNQPLLPGMIPSSVQSLKFGNWFNQPLSHCTIPSSVQSLTFGDRFNQPLLPGTIPSSVQSLKFGNDFDQPLLPGTIPSSVKSLTFGYWFNQPLLPGTFPSSIQSLTFGDWFNQPLLPGTIPSSVQSLTFGNWFNQPLSHCTIPSSVQSLIINKKKKIISRNIEENNKI